jgi:hypothetical protein
MEKQPDTWAQSLVRGRIGAGLMGVAAALLGLLGYDFGPDMQAHATELVGSVLAGAAGLLALVSKIRESKAGKDQSGFVAWPLLPVLIVVAVAVLSACAWQGGKTEQAAKSLLTLQATIVEVAGAADELCADGTIKPDDCARISTYYERAKSTYDVAESALVVAIESGDAEGWNRFTAARSRLSQLTADLSAAATEYGVTGGDK